MPVRGHINNRTDSRAEEIRIRAADGEHVGQLADYFGVSIHEIRGCAKRNGFRVASIPRRRGKSNAGTLLEPRKPLTPAQAAELLAAQRAAYRAAPQAQWCPECKQMAYLDREGFIGDHPQRRPGEDYRLAAPCYGVGRPGIKR